MKPYIYALLLALCSIFSANAQAQDMEYTDAGCSAGPDGFMLFPAWHAQFGPATAEHPWRISWEKSPSFCEGQADWYDNYGNPAPVFKGAMVTCPPVPAGEVSWVLNKPIQKCERELPACPIDSKRRKTYYTGWNTTGDGVALYNDPGSPMCDGGCAIEADNTDTDISCWSEEVEPGKHNYFCTAGFKTTGARCPPGSNDGAAPDGFPNGPDPDGGGDDGGGDDGGGDNGGGDNGGDGDGNGDGDGDGDGSGGDGSGSGNTACPPGQVETSPGQCSGQSGGGGTGDGEDNTDGTPVAIGELYTKKDKTFESVLQAKRGELLSTQVGSTVNGFFNVTGGGSCPVWTANIPYIEETVTIDQFCSQTATMAITVLKGVVLLVGAFLAFRVAFL